MNPALPQPCGPISTLVLSALQGRLEADADVRLPDRVADPLLDKDFQLGLWLSYEPHFRDLPGVDPGMEWDPGLLAIRAELETIFEAALRDLVGEVPEGDPAEEIRRMTASSKPSPLSLHLGRDATREEFVDYLRQRATYHLRESDPQSFTLARIDGRAKVALAELQYDEFGAGRPDRLHSHIYAQGMAGLGLSTDVHDYIDEAEATVLTTVNTMSFFTLHRRLRGAAMGHLAAFEATSSLPCRLVAGGAQRLDLPAAVVDYYQEHVEADSVHEQVAIDDICGALVEAEPHVARDVVFGAMACLAVDDITAEALLARWGVGEQAERVAS